MRKPTELTPDQQARLEASFVVAARQDFGVFVDVIHRAMTGSVFDLQPFHAQIITTLEAVYRHELPRVVINLPPRSGKTTLVQYFVAWTLGRHPDSNNILISANADLAERGSLETQAILASAKYREIFPGTAIPRETSARDDWTTAKGGRTRATGVGGLVTGYGAGKDRGGRSNEWGGMIVFDDPHKPTEVDSKVSRDEVSDFFVSSVASRRNTAATPMIVIQQRLHEDDLTGRLLTGLTGESWHQVVIPGLDEQDRSFWERRRPAAELTVMRAARPREFWSQIMQDPQPPSGVVFRPEQIPLVDAPPSATSIAYCRGWDLAASAGEGDWTVGALVGRYKADDGGSRFVVRNVVRLRGTADQVRDLILRTARADGRSVRVSLPQDPGQAGKAQVASLVGMLAGFKAEASPESGSKETRAEPLASVVNVGLVAFVRGAWNATALDEMRSFPGGRHDDIVDAMSRAFNTVNDGPIDPGHFAAIGAAMRQSEEPAAPRTVESYMPGLIVGGPGHVLAQVIESVKPKVSPRSSHSTYFERIRAQYQADLARQQEQSP